MNFLAACHYWETLNVGGIDLSADVADTVPVFALAAGVHSLLIATLEKADLKTGCGNHRIGQQPAQL
jgi:hypothetical protein